MLQRAPINKLANTGRNNMLKATSVSLQTACHYEQFEKRVSKTC